MTFASDMAKLLLTAAAAVAFSLPSPAETRTRTLAHTLDSLDFEMWSRSDQIVGGMDDLGILGYQDSRYVTVGVDANKDSVKVITKNKPYSGSRPPEWAQALSGSKYLDVALEKGTLFRTVTPGDGMAVSNGVSVSTNGVWVDSLVQFKVGDFSPAQLPDGSKFAVYLGVATNSAGKVTATNLFACASWIGDNGAVFTNAPHVYAFNFKCLPGEWHRLTVRMVPSVMHELTEWIFGRIPAFSVQIDGVDVATTAAGTSSPFGSVSSVVAEVARSEGVPNDGWLDADVKAAVTAGRLFPAIKLPSADDVEEFFSASAFQGNGAIDEYMVTTVEPGTDLPFASVDFTLNFGAGVSAVSYVIGDGEPKECKSGESISGLSPSTQVRFAVACDSWYVNPTIKDAAGATVNGAIVTVNAANASASVSATRADAADESVPASALGVTAAGFAGVSAPSLARWASAAGGKSMADVNGNLYAKDSYLLNSWSVAKPSFEITDVREADGAWRITVQARVSPAPGADETAVDLGAINGRLCVKSAQSLSGGWTETEIDLSRAVFDPSTREATFAVPSGSFFKAEIK